MINTLRGIVGGALDRLAQQVRDDLPPLLAAAAIMLFAWMMARVSRWLVRRMFRGIQAERWWSRSGLASIVDASGRFRASRVAGQAAYWAVLIVGALTALNAFGGGVTSRLVQAAVLLFPRLLLAGAIVVAGLWLAQYLGRSMLLFAVNENLPSPRRLAAAVRAAVVFVAVVAAADTVNFARDVFLAAFVLILGAAALAAGLALGLGARDAVRRGLNGREAETRDETEEHSVWSHL